MVAFSVSPNSSEISPAFRSAFAAWPYCFSLIQSSPASLYFVRAFRFESFVCSRRRRSASAKLESAKPEATDVVAMLGEDWLLDFDLAGNSDRQRAARSSAKTAPLRQENLKAEKRQVIS